MKMSIGFDVSKATVDVAVFDGMRINHFKVKNGIGGFDEILCNLKECSLSETIVTMEATGVYHQKAADYFYRKGFRVQVVNPLIIKRYSEMKMLRAKTDKVDAKIIAKYGFYEEGGLYSPRSENSLKIIGFLKVLEDLHQTKTQNMNRLEALKHCALSIKEVEDIYMRINDGIDTEIKKIEKDILLLVKIYSPEAYQNLTSIPGIGKRISSALIGYFGNMESFESSKQLASYIGINPSLRISGTSVRSRGAISKKGNGYLRKLMYMAALSACRWNRSCKALYERMLQRGKDKRVALIAVANKLIRQAFAIVKYDRRYDQKFCSI
jgi:transposase